MIVFAALSVSAAWSQNLDSSGNGLLKGAYHFRLLEAANFDQTTEDVTRPSPPRGTITFDGAGNYTVTGSAVDSTGAAQTLSAGTYLIGAGELDTLSIRWTRRISFTVASDRASLSAAARKALWIIPSL